MKYIMEETRQIYESKLLNWKSFDGMCFQAIKVISQ
jgi:hypothetical protein